MCKPVNQGCKEQVFLGGSCNPTTWRKDIAIPMLEEAKVAYYNPQVDDWHDGLVKLEADAKNDSQVLLFIIDSQTRATASMLEATEYIVAGRNVVLVINNVVDGTVVEGQTITGRELKDLNRNRTYLKDVASRYGVNVFMTVEEAVKEVIDILS